jgi:hypothetical protein
MSKQAMMRVVTWQEMALTHSATGACNFPVQSCVLEPSFAASFQSSNYDERPAHFLQLDQTYLQKCIPKLSKKKLPFDHNHQKPKLPWVTSTPLVIVHLCLPSNKLKEKLCRYFYSLDLFCFISICGHASDLLRHVFTCYLTFLCYSMLQHRRHDFKPTCK